MMYYIVYVFGMAGLTGQANLVASSISYVINVFMTIFALIFIDRWGRRKPLLVGAALMCTWMFGNAGLMASYGRPAPEGGVGGIQEQSWQIEGAPARAVIAFTYLFVASFAPTWGPVSNGLSLHHTMLNIEQVSWIYPPELFPLRVRGKAVALTTSSNWMFNFALSYFVPPAFVNIKWRAYLIFGCFNVAMFVHVFLCFPEVGAQSKQYLVLLVNNCRPRARPWNRSRRCFQPRSRRGRLASSTKSLDERKQVMSTWRRNSATQRTSRTCQHLPMSQRLLKGLQQPPTMITEISYGSTLSSE